MAAARPDVAYFIVMLDDIKEDAPEVAGDALRRVMKGLEAGELSPLVHTRWSMAEAGSAMKFMRAARHTGKIVLATPPVANGSLAERQDLSGHRRAWRHRVRRGGVAGGTGRRCNRAERSRGAGCGR